MSIPVLGQWIDARDVPSKSTFDVLDPATGEVIAQAARGGAEEANAAVLAGRRSLSGPWAKFDGRDRAACLFQLAKLLERDRPKLRRLLSLENGKPLHLADHEITTAIRYCEYYGAWADKIGGRTIPVDKAHFAYTLREPLGVIVLIVPWNYPIDIMLRGLAPALAAGNAVIVKPAEDTPLTTIEVGRLCVEAGFPAGTVNVVTGFGAEAGAALTGHPGIHGISFCGSARTGVSVAQSASANLIPVLSLELGGKCPSLVLPDGDVEGAARTIAGGLVYNAGQSCVARSRFIIHRSQVKKAEQVLQDALAKTTLGHGIDDPDMGPLINGKQWTMVNQACIDAETRGARVVFRGDVPKTLLPGRFLPPTVFGVSPTMDLARDEVFGPVLALIPYDTEEEGIAIANDTEYGLAAELWSGSPAKAHGVARRINASHITINGSGGFGIEVPFGGIGRSGYGREGGEEGLLQYTRVKSVYMSIDLGEQHS
jgi:acyl-CoA reductase-like NAD-dependent aldehyde dehydrogenase